MNCYEIQELGYAGQVKQCSQHSHQFYSYSVLRIPQRERLFDGVAGDIAEAVSTLRAHIQYLSADRGSPVTE
jgi:hypothetical protein